LHLAHGRVDRGEIWFEGENLLAVGKKP